MPSTVSLTRRTRPRRGWRRFVHGQRGQNLVEFALAVPILSLVLFGIVEFGNVMRIQVELDEAVRTGARQAAILPSGGSFASTVETAVATSAPDLSAMSFSPTPAYPAACPASTAEVTVGVNYSYTPITPVGSLVSLMHGTLNSPSSLSSTTTVHSECN